MAFTSGTYFTGLTIPSDGLNEAEVNALITTALMNYATETYVENYVFDQLNVESLLVTDDDHDQDLTHTDVRMYVGTNKEINLLTTGDWLHREYCFKNLALSAGTVTINAFAGNIFDDNTATFVLSPGDFIRLKAQPGLNIDRR